MLEIEKVNVHLHKMTPYKWTNLSVFLEPTEKKGCMICYTLDDAMEAHLQAVTNSNMKFS